MAEFYDNRELFVVQPEKASKKKRNYFNILNAGAGKLAVMFHRPDSIFVKFLRLVNFKASYGASIIIQGREGEPLLHFRKAFTLGLFTAEVFDGKGARLGTVTEKKYGLEGRTYELTGAGGDLLGTLQGDWRAYNLQLYDKLGNLIGKLGKWSDAVNSVLFPTKDFFVVHLYVPQKDETVKKVLFGTCAAIDLLLR